MQVESIVLSIISMLSSPNDESPANVEAAVSSNNYFYLLDCFIATYIPSCHRFTYLYRREHNGILTDFFTIYHRSVIDFSEQRIVYCCPCSYWLEIFSP